MASTGRPPAGGDSPAPHSDQRERQPIRAKAREISPLSPIPPAGRPPTADRRLSRSKTRSRAVSWYVLRNQRRGWDYLGVLLSLVHRLARCPLGLLAVLVRSDLSKDAELLVLRHENQALRRQLGGRLRWDHADRLWRAALSRLVSRHQRPLVFPVTPATILRWHRDLVAPQVDLHRSASARTTVYRRLWSRH